MSEIRLYVDEDSMDQALVRALRARNVDVITVGEAQTEGDIDEDQLAFALLIFAVFTQSLLLKVRFMLGLLCFRKTILWVSNCEQF
jgi:hypothetical protein